MKSILVATTALVAFATSAVAADLSPRSYNKAPAAAVSNSWAGFYLGAFGGYGWSNFISDMAPGDLKGGFGGATAGYNFQTGNFVYGLEGELAGASIKTSFGMFSSSAEKTINTFGSVAARLGYSFGNTLVYGKVGYGWANAGIQDSGIKFTKAFGGVVAGAGVEHKFASNWSVKAEYLYQHLEGGFVYAIPATASNLQTVKVGVNYHFGR